MRKAKNTQIIKKLLKHSSKKCIRTSPKFYKLVANEQIIKHLYIIINKLQLIEEYN